MQPYLSDYILVFLFLIVSGLSLHLVALEDENRAQSFRSIVIVLYGISGIIVLFIFVQRQ
jgi:hypothetical protein